MATVLFKGGLSEEAETDGGSAIGCTLPLPLFTQGNFFFPPPHQCLTCAVSGGPPGQPLTQWDLHTPHEAVHVLRGAVAWLLQQICQCPGEGVEGC